MGHRTDALTKRRHYVLAVWPSLQDRELGGLAIRLATGVDSRTGQQLEIDGKSYAPHLPPDLEHIRAFSMEAQSISVSVPWMFINRQPIDVSFAGGVGELATVYEGDSWDDRVPMILGSVSSPGRAGTKEMVELTLTSFGPTGRGDIFPPGAELSSSAFDDIGDGETPAGQSAGVLPPYVFAPVGSSIQSPILCVVNDTKIASGASYTFRQYHLGMGEPWEGGSSKQFALVHPSNNERFAAALDSSVFQSTPAIGEDDTGATYWGVSANWPVPIGGASTDWDVISDEVTPLKARGLIAEGDYVRRNSDGITDWTEVESVDGDTLTLTSTYVGSSGTEAGVCQRYPALIAYQAYMVREDGGDALEDGSGPNTKLVDVMGWMMERAGLGPIEVAYGDLEALRPRLDHLTVSNIAVSRQDGFAWLQEKILPHIPVTPYLEGAHVRFKWVGPIAEEEVAATFDLDDLGEAWRVGTIKEDAAPLVYDLTLNYRYMLFKQGYTRTISQAPGAPTPTNPTTGRPYENVGRAQDAYTASLSERPGQDPEDSRWNGSCEFVEFASDAGVVLAFKLWESAVRRETVTALLPNSYHWLKAGDVIQATSSGLTRDAQKWRILAIADRVSGPLRTLLRSEPT